MRSRYAEWACDFTSALLPYFNDQIEDLPTVRTNHPETRSDPDPIAAGTPRAYSRFPWTVPSE